MRRRNNKETAEKYTPPQSTMLTKLSQIHYFTIRCYLMMQSYSFPTVRSAYYHTISYRMSPLMNLIVRVDVTLVTVLSKYALLPYTYQRTKTMKLLLVRQLMR